MSSARPACALGGVLLLGVTLASRPSRATPACETFPELGRLEQWRPESQARLAHATNADVQHVSPAAGWLCNVEPALHAVRGVERRSVALDCSSARCALGEPPPFDDATFYLLRDQNGQPLLARPGKILNVAHSRPSLPAGLTGLTVERLAIDGEVELLERAELVPRGNRCFSLPPGQQLQPHGLYLANGASGSPVMIVASQPAPNSPPRAPELRVEQEDLSHACSSHGLFWFVPTAPSPSSWFVWSVYDAAGSTRVVGPLLGPVPWAFGLEHAQPSEWVLELDREYVLEAQAIDGAGQLSPSSRMRFELVQTGSGPRYWIFFLLGALLLLGTLAMVGLFLRMLYSFTRDVVRARRRRAQRQPPA